jgi:hypothetical protein
VIESDDDTAVNPRESVAVKTSPDSAVVEVGVPEKVPFVFRGNPAGKVPDVSVQVSAPVPPVAVSVAG